MGSATVGLDLVGFEEMEQLLRLDPVGGKNAIIAALRKALAPVLMEVLRQVPVDSGQLKSSIVIAIPKTRKKTLIRVEIQAGEIPGHPKQWEAFWALFVEYGTVNADGSTAIHANPFMRRSFEMTNEEARSIARREILQAIWQVLSRKAA